MIEPRAQNSSKLSDFLQIKSPTLPSRKDRALVVIPGDVLLSHKVALAVPSALEGLTSVFGMGTGVGPSATATGKLIRISSAFALPGDGGGNLLRVLQMRCVANREQVHLNFALGKFYGQASRPISTR